MEYIERIFFRKINPSDFKKLYDIDRPENGGGQTYLDATGISNEKIDDFLSYAEVSDSPLKEKGEIRSVYTFNAYVLGNYKAGSAFIEFAPRNGRNNYRISRQNMKYKHPAWSIDNGFPEANKDTEGNYTSEGNFDGIIDNLIIWIIRTSNRKYYAGFINRDTMPDEWPANIGLEEIFKGERRGVINTEPFGLQFIDDKECPFGDCSIMSLDELRVSTGENILLYGVPGSGKSWTIQHEYCDDEKCMERLVFHPDYMYSDFIGQILPVVKKDDEGKEKVRYEFKPGPFTKILKKAYEDPNKSYYLVIEEINRGNAPAIFGEIFQLLDRIAEDKDGFKKGTSEYGITNENIALEVYGNSETKVRIPANLSILGTMNTSDQNVFTLDTAFQRRWIMRMIKNSFNKHKYAENYILDTSITWKQFCEAINEEILRRNNVTSSEDKRLGAYFVSEDDLVYVETKDDFLEKQIIEVEHKNARFAEKVMKYLWDDAFKFAHSDVFDTRKYKSLEMVIETFNTSRGNDRFKVYNENLKKLIINGVDENNSVSEEDNE